MTLEAKRLSPIAPGDRIRAPWLNDTVSAVNDLQRQIAAPRQVNGPTPSPASNETSAEASEQTQAADGLATALDPTLQGEAWNELQKTTVTVRVFDPNDENVWIDEERRVQSIIRTPTGLIELNWL